ncbi:hypothetical protein Salat_1320500 [Sesamum alatum]|uniref:BAH domain-containing protein n=1 Tax=Sesamum alatum TaxID=300844 RepID=A0AAE1YIN8_9LAMI|nr:hypothetical protein Salat_1320500 [Sesamum alatum]
MGNSSTASYVSWEEVMVSSEKGRREVHYYLKRCGGGRDLVVVGKEKSARHMSYHYAIKDNKSLLPILNRSFRLKLRSRREVIDWFSSILSGEQHNGSLGQFQGGMESELDNDFIKPQRLEQSRSEFKWLGSSWCSRKRRRHYQSFRRNGAVISVQDFVYVLAEEDKRLVAYLDDMYEDPRGNKMVVVRWFHKIDEVGFVLPRKYNDREIFFSLCLQDLSIECIDGLATVLSPEHYEKFSDEATRMGLMPFVCYRQFDDDDVKPFDITRIKGYWKQEILRNRSTLLEHSDDDLKLRGSIGDVVGDRPNKRIRWSKDCDSYLNSPDKKETAETSLQVCSGSTLESKGVKVGSLKEGCSYVPSSGTDNTTPPKTGCHLTIGSQVEVLSQDSGIRGCWFRASIIKKHKDKVKVRYRDLKDAVDDSKNLEEWILASRLATPDALGIRLSGRTIVRPTLSSDISRVSGVLNVGSVVDAWWHDAWWEGIVVKKESEDKLHIYFPEERQELTFGPCDLRCSKEWFANGWQNIKERPDLVSAFSGINKVSDIDRDGASFDNKDLAAPIQNDDALPQTLMKIGDSVADNDGKMPIVRDLSKDYLLARLRWKSSGKRRRCRSPIHKVHFGTNGSSFETGLQTFKKFFASSSLKFDPDYCKYASDSHFSSSVVPPLTNLVMSRLIQIDGFRVDLLTCAERCLMEK